MSQAVVQIVVILAICGLISGSIGVAPITNEVRRWSWVTVLLGTAGFFAWRFLL